MSLITTLGHILFYEKEDFIHYETNIRLLCVHTPFAQYKNDNVGMCSARIKITAHITVTDMIARITTMTKNGMIWKQFRKTVQDAYMNIDLNERNILAHSKLHHLADNALTRKIKMSVYKLAYWVKSVASGVRKGLKKSWKSVSIKLFWTSNIALKSVFCLCASNVSRFSLNLKLFS